MVLAGIVSAQAADGRLAEHLAKVPPAELVAGADHYGAVTGSPPWAEVLAGGKRVGFAFVNADWVNSTGYSGQPIEILVGLSVEGKITGARLMAHHEPIVLIGIPPARIAAFIQGYVGTDVVALGRDAAAERPKVDIVSGATVTVAVIADSMVRSGVRVARTLGIGGATAPVATVAREIDPTHEAPADWPGLLGDGSVRRLALSVGEVSEAFRRAGHPEAADRPEVADASGSFIDLYVAPVSVPAIGRSLLGEQGYAALAASLKPGQAAILIAADGAYSFKGSGYVRGGIFDRIEVDQGDAGIHFHDRNHTRIGDVVARGAPKFRDVDIFRVPDTSTFDAAAPWTLRLLAQRATGARDKAFLTFDVGYALPEAYLKPVVAPPPVATTGPAAKPAAAATPTSVDPSDAAPPIWQRLWRDKVVEIAVLLVAIGVLTLIFFFQDWFVRRPLFYDPGAAGLHDLHARLHRLVRPGAALGGQRPRLPRCAQDRLPLGLFPDGAADLHPVVRHRGVAAVLEPRRLLWLAVPVRRAAGTGEPPGQGRRHPAAEDLLHHAPAAHRAEIHRLPRAVRDLPERARDGREGGRGRAVQDRHHPALRPANGRSSSMPAR